MSNLEKVYLVIGVILLLVGAFLMIEGSILGDRTIPAAIVSTIVGISFIIGRIKAKKS